MLNCSIVLLVIGKQSPLLTWLPEAATAVVDNLFDLFAFFSCGDRDDWQGLAPSMAPITARCAFGDRDRMKSIRPCVYSYDLDLKTLIWTRGAAFPLSDLGTRLKCPSCGSRRVALVFHMPKEPQATKAGRTSMTRTECHPPVLS